MHSRIVAIVGTMAIALLGSTGAVAQDATPEASPGGESLFTDLGLPELTVTATSEGFELSETEVEAGRYLVHLVNETDRPDIAAGFVRLIDGKTLDDLSFADEMAAGTPMPEAMPDVESFAWMYDTYIAGGVTSDSDRAVIDLRGGDYGVWADDPTSPIPAAPLTVTGDPDARLTAFRTALPSSLFRYGEEADHAFKGVRDGARDGIGHEAGKDELARLRI
ncbi:MAG TPA: hypothetical protein VHG52_06505 [Thermomicrobiales bacterium]|nr:hypothetical protein [Thermomicrobiales bacterium]